MLGEEVGEEEDLFRVWLWDSKKRSVRREIQDVSRRGTDGSALPDVDDGRNILRSDWGQGGVADELEMDVCGVVFVRDRPWNEGVCAIRIGVYSWQVRGIICEGSDTWNVMFISQIRMRIMQ